MVVSDIYIYQLHYFPCSLFYLSCFSCSLWYGGLLTFDIALQFVWRRCALHTVTITWFEQTHMYKSCALWWGGAGPCWTWIPEPHLPLLFSHAIVLQQLASILHSTVPSPKPLCLWHWAQACPHVESLTPCLNFSFVVKSILRVVHAPPPSLQSRACTLTVVFHCAHPSIVAFALFCMFIPSCELFSAFTPSHALSHISALPHFCTHN